jgi:hypothetical protein
MALIRSTSRTPSPSSSSSPPPPNNPDRRRSSRIASSRLQCVFDPKPTESSPFKQYSQDPYSQNTQCSSWSDEENSDLDSDGEPLLQKAKIKDFPLRQPTPKVDVDSIDYGNLPLIDVWEAKGKSWTQEEVEKLPGFYKVKPDSKPDNKKEEEHKGEDDIPISHVLCNGGPSSYGNTVTDELLACSLAPLPDDDDDVDLPSTTERKQGETTKVPEESGFWDGELVYGVMPCMNQPLPDSDAEDL